MITIIIYDIEETKNRNHVIKKIQHYGLKRIQKSAFMGDINKQDRKELSEKLSENIQEEKDSILIIPICNNCQQKITSHGMSVEYEEEEYRIE